MRRFGQKHHQNPVELLPIILAGLTGAGAAAGSVLATRALEPQHQTLSNPRITFLPQAKVALGSIAALAAIVITSRALGADIFTIRHDTVECTVQSDVVRVQPTVGRK